MVMGQLCNKKYIYNVELITGNVNVLNDVKYVVFVDLPLLLSVENMVNGTLQAFVIRGLRARKLPANSSNTIQYDCSNRMFKYQLF
jgi:hypothetical protein